MGAEGGIGHSSEERILPYPEISGIEEKAVYERPRRKIAAIGYGHPLHNKTDNIDTGTPWSADYSL